MRPRNVVLIFVLLAALTLSGCQPIQPTAQAEGMRRVYGALYLPAVFEWGGVAVSLDFDFTETDPATHAASGAITWRNFQPQPPAGEGNWRAVTSDVLYAFFGADEVGGDPDSVVVITEIKEADGWGQGEPGEYARFWLRQADGGAPGQWGMTYYSFDPWYEFYPVGAPPVDDGYLTVEEIQDGDPSLPLTAEFGTVTIEE